MADCADRVNADQVQGFVVSMTDRIQHRHDKIREAIGSSPLTDQELTNLIALQLTAAFVDGICSATDSKLPPLNLADDVAL